MTVLFLGFQVGWPIKMDEVVTDVEDWPKTSLRVPNDFLILKIARTNHFERWRNWHIVNNQPLTITVFGKFWSTLNLLNWFTNLPAFLYILLLQIWLYLWLFDWRWQWRRRRQWWKMSFSSQHVFFSFLALPLPLLLRYYDVSQWKTRFLILMIFSNKSLYFVSLQKFNQW